MRVVSLLPSATEIVCLVAEHAAAANGSSGDGATPALELVGRSHECDFPASLSHLPMLTAAKTKWTDSADVDRQVREALASGQGLYTVDREALAALRPDAIITQSLCSVCSVDLCAVQGIAAGIEPQPLVIDLNPHSLDEVLADVQRVGKLLGVPAAGVAAAAALRRRVEAAVAAVPPGAAPQTVAFLEWTAPIFCGGHWTPQLIEMAGGQHPLNPTRGGGGAGKSVVVTPQQVAECSPDWVIVCPCGLDLPTARKEAEASFPSQAWWQELPAVQKGQVLLVDGNQMFNRPCPLLVDCLEFLVGQLHGRPNLVPADFPFERL